MNTFTGYLTSGAVDVVGTVAGVTLFVQVTKGALGSFAKPNTDAYTSLVRLYTIVLSVIAVAFLWWAGPGFHTPGDVGAAAFAAVSAVLSSWGIYGVVRGPVPQTPDQHFTQKLAGAVVAIPTVTGSAMTQTPQDISVKVEGQVAEVIQDVQDEIAVMQSNLVQALGSLRVDMEKERAVVHSRLDNIGSDVSNLVHRRSGHAAKGPAAVVTEPVPEVDPTSPVIVPGQGDQTP